MSAFIKLLFTAFAQSITSFIFILIIMMVFANIKRRARLEESWLGFLRDTTRNQLLNAMLYGMIVGLIASTLIIVIGITIDVNTILAVWPLALLLMFFNQRYMCFSYAGGIVSLISLIFGWPHVDVSAIIALVGVLHLMESLLILLDGHKGALPVIMEHKRFNPIGAYVMNKLWPIPLVILAIPSEVIRTALGGINMPDWWPLFHGQAGVKSLVLIPLAAILGYGDIAITHSTKKRAKETGFWLGAYSLVILILAIISSRIFWVKYIAAITTPVLHELLIYLGKRGQLEGKPIYGAPWRGIRILDVFPESIGSKMDLKPGDIFMNLNGRGINSEEMLSEALSYSPSYIWVDVNRDGETKTLEYRDYQQGIKQLGILFVPRKTSRFFIMEEQKSLITRLWKRIIKKKDIPL